MSNITLQISANVQQAVNGISSVNQKINQLSITTASASSAVAKTAANFTLFSTSLGIVSNLIRETIQTISELTTKYSVQEKTEIRLQSTLKETQNACGMTASEMIFAMWENIFS